MAATHRPTGSQRNGGYGDHRCTTVVLCPPSQRTNDTTTSTWAVFRTTAHHQSGSWGRVFFSKPLDSVPCILCFWFLSLTFCTGGLMCFTLRVFFCFSGPISNGVRRGFSFVGRTAALHGTLGVPGPGPLWGGIIFWPNTRRGTEGQRWTEAITNRN